MQASHNGYSSILYIEHRFLQENILRAVWQGSGHYRRDHPEAAIDYVTCGYELSFRFHIDGYEMVMPVRHHLSAYM